MFICLSIIMIITQKFGNYRNYEKYDSGIVMEQEKAIIIENLTKLYGEHIGVKNLNLSVDKGEIMGFLGPNGAGKTTTLRSSLALISKTAGKITIFGLDSHRDAVAIRKKTGYLPGDFGLIPSVSARSYLKYMLSLNNHPSTKKMMSLAESLELELDRKTNELSKGNKQKVGIIQVLMADQELIIMDEPTSGLDPLMQQEFYRILREEKSQGKTIFMASHNLAEVEKVCDRVAIIRKGHLEVVEKIQSLQEKTGKVLEVEFSDPVSVDEFQIEGVSEVREDDGKLTLTIHENLDGVIEAVSRHRIRNMNLRTYSLEQLFLKYYKEENQKRGDV